MENIREQIVRISTVEGVLGLCMYASVFELGWDKRCISHCRSGLEKFERYPLKK